MPSFFLGQKLFRLLCYCGKYLTLKAGRDMIMKKLYIDIFENEKGVKAFFSTKHGASNGSPYYNAETLSSLGLMDLQPVQPNQVHEAKIGIVGKEKCSIIDEAGKEIMSWGRMEESPVIESWIQGGVAGPGNEAAGNASAIRFPRTDGAITDQPGVLLTTVHADCLPVWFYDGEHHAIGLVHAGWRGTLAGIAPKAVRLMNETYGSDPAKMKAYIGPGISQCCFETGPEVLEAFRSEWDFADEYSETAEEHAAKGRPANEGKCYIDIKGINVRELLQAGLLPENIEVSAHCTCCEPETFASYRREGGTYMRMGAGICLL